MVLDSLKNQIESEPFVRIWKMIYDHLYKEIITLELFPGSKITESGIAKELAISRSPVKKALDLLVHEKLLVDSGYGGFTVSQINRKDCITLCEARVSVEGHAAFMAAKLISKAQLQRLEELLRGFQRIDNLDENLLRFVIYDDEFHQIIMDACQNSYISEMYALLHHRILRYRYYIMKLKLGEYPALPRHKAIYHALSRNSSQMAKDEMEMDIRGMYNIALEMQ